jgi:hypothetical protein
MKKYTRKETAAYSQANAIVHEVLSAIRTVTAFGGQRRELDRSVSLLLIICISIIFFLSDMKNAWLNQKEWVTKKDYLWVSVKHLCILLFMVLLL